MSKISNSKFRASLMASGLDTDTIEKMVTNAIKQELVSSSSRVGKLQFAPASFLEKWDACVKQFELDKEEWESNLPNGETLSKISLNCNK